jgi:hypothetical protein
MLGSSSSVDQVRTLRKLSGHPNYQFPHKQKRKRGLFLTGDISDIVAFCSKIAKIVKRNQREYSDRTPIVFFPHLPMNIAAAENAWMCISEISSTWT